MARIGSLALVLAAVVAATLARNKAPLIDEDGTRLRNKAAECIFGKEVRELGSKWTPDLGVPFGVMYCMKCECVPIQRKRRIVGRVQCRSIQDECPKPSCDEPVLLKGRCCKTCPGDDAQNPNEIQDIGHITDEEEKTNKHYAALLTGRSSLQLKNDYVNMIANDPNKNSVAATARFTFHKKSLHYSFYISEKGARPRSLQFVDSEGNILEEFTLSRTGGVVDSAYQNATRKVCGVWKHLPKTYRKLLRQEKMFVFLVWGGKDQAQFTLSGQVKKYEALSTEIFSSLLESAPGSDSELMVGSGGTAIVSTSTSVTTPQLHVAIIFNGLFTSEDSYNVPLNITLALDEKKTIILDKVVEVQKTSPDLNYVEAIFPMSLPNLRSLTRGRILLSISSVSKPEALRLSGNVITKVACEMFQAILSSSSSDHSLNPIGTSGLAWFYLNNEGSLIYNVQVDNLSQFPAFITLEDVTTKRKTELEDLTPSYRDGWANGTVDKLSPKVLEPLYSGNLAVYVKGENEKSLIKGKLVAKSVADARDAPAPILMKRENFTISSGVVGLAWINIDNDCHLHYDVTVNGINEKDKNMELYLELLPLLAPGAPVITKHLGTFSNNQIEGSPIESLNKEELLRFDSGIGFLKVRDVETRVILLVGTVKHIKVPSSCTPVVVDNNLPKISDHPIVITRTKECFYESKFYQDETQWVTTSDPCTMCFCQDGNYKCDTMVCPEISCPNGVNKTIPGECCPVCSTHIKESADAKKCIFNGKTYLPGSKFSPFLIPTGFDSCTECTCDPVDIEIKCERVNDTADKCGRNRYRVDNSMNKTFYSDDHAVATTEKARAPRLPPAKDVLADGGCPNPSNPLMPYANGSQFHPYINTLGEYKCVTCNCSNGKIQCERYKCSKMNCRKLFAPSARRSDPMDVCCRKECRKLRHKKNHRRNMALNQNIS